MLLRGEHDDRTITVLNLMLTTTKRTSVLIDNVLDFARGRWAAVWISNVKILRLWLRCWNRSLQKSGPAIPNATLTRKLDVDVAIEADPLRIAQLFSNLLGDAVTHGNPKQPIRVTASVNKGHLEVAVTNGGGEPIPDAAREYLFLPFYRGKVKPHQQGLGLGLYIASQIAQAHGGRIDLEFEAEATRFTFRMPIS